MAGRGEMLPGDRQPLEGVFILGQDDVPVPACAPLNQYSTIRKKKSIQGLNPAWSFARKMYRETGRPLLLVVNAKGGTSIDLWTKTAPCDTFRTRRGDEPELNGTVTPQFYSEAVRRTREAMQYGRLKGILWHQGESDSGSQESRDAYMGKLSGLVSDIRKDLGRKVPFVAGEVYEKGVSRAINPVLDGISGYIPKSCCVSSAGLPSSK